MSDLYKIKEGLFDGPLELLLELIEKKKLSINDVSLAAITEEYVNSVCEQENLSAEEVSHFVSIASLLLYIKSKSLLPQNNIDEEEDDVIVLKLRLQLLKEMQESGDKIANTWRKRSFLSKKRPINKKGGISFAPGNSYTIDKVHALVSSFVDYLPQKREKVLIEERMFPLKAMLKRIEDVLRKISNTSFNTIAKEATKKEVIVLFIALLELVKSGHCQVEQDNTFSDISVSK